MLNRSKTGRLRLPRPNSERDAPSWALADPLSGDGGAAPDSPARASSDPKLLQKKRAQRTESVHEVRTGWGDDLVADYRILFDEIDIDHSGLIDAFELEKVFKKLELRFSRRKVQEMINSVDCTGDGEIDFEEFLTLLFKLHDPKARSWNLTVVFDYTEFTKPCLQQVRSDVWDALDDPSSSTCARVLTISIISVILLSTFLIVLQSIPEYYADENGVFFALEFACGVAFSLEFFVRCLTTPNCGQFVSGFMNWIDLLSIIPFWGEIIIMAMNNNMAEGVEMIDARDVEFLVAMRAFRVFRVLKVSHPPPRRVRRRAPLHRPTACQSPAIGWSCFHNALLSSLSVFCACSSLLNAFSLVHIFATPLPLLLLLHLIHRAGCCTAVCIVFFCCCRCLDTSHG